MKKKSILLVASLFLACGAIATTATALGTTPAIATKAEAETTTVEKTAAEIATENKWQGNGAEAYTSFKLDDNITISTTGSGNNGKYYTEWRLYQVGNGNVIITAGQGVTIKNVTLTYSTSKGGILLDDGTAYTSGTTVTVNGTSKTFTVGNTGTATNGQARITKFKVEYTGGVTKTLESIAVSGTPTKTEYYEGEKFDPSGLTVTGTYSDSSTGNIGAGITWTVNPETVTLGTTSVDVTATVEGLTSATYTVTSLKVNALPFYSHSFLAYGEGFTQIKVPTEEGAEKIPSFAETVTLDDEAWTATGAVADGLSVYVGGKGAGGQQFGTSTNPFSSLSFASNNFGGKKITRAVIKTKGASGTSKFDIVCTINGEVVGKTVHIEGNTEQTAAFETEGAYGEVKFSFTNIEKGIYVTALEMTGVDATDTTAQAHAFARQVEAEDSCSGTHAELIAAYDALTPEIKDKADAIVIHDWNGVAEDKGAKTAEITVANKMSILKAEAANMKIANFIEESHSSITAVAGVAAAGLAAAAGLFIVSKKKKADR